MKIWMTDKGGRYAARMLLGTVGIAAAALAGVCLLAVGGIVLGWPAMEAALLALIFAAAVTVALAVLLGRACVRDALIFYQDEEGALWVLDARWMAGGRSSLIMAAETGRFLKKVRQAGAAAGPLITGAGGRVLSVENLKPLWRGHSAVCRISLPGGRVCRRSFRIGGIPDEEELLAVLSRLMPEGAEPDPFDNRNRIKGLCFLLLFVLCAAVCALSHPAAGVLPQEIYFPFLGISLLPLCAAVYFFIRHHRGE